MLRLVDILIQLPSNKISIVFWRKGQGVRSVTPLYLCCVLLIVSEAIVSDLVVELSVGPRRGTVALVSLREEHFDYL